MELAVKITDSTLVSRVPSVSHKVENNLFFLKESSDELFQLNETAAFIWELIEKPTPFSSLIQKTTDEFEVEGEVVEEDLRDLIELLHKKKVVVLTNKS